MKIINSFITIVFLVIVSELCFSQWSTDPSQNLRVTTIGLSPKIVSDAAGGAYILYKDMPLDLVHLYLQRLDRYGYRKFPGNGVMIADASHFQGHIYFIINDEKGGAIIAFSDEYPVDEVGHLAISVYVQRIDSTGNKRWGDNGIAVDLYEQAELIPVSLCSNGEGGCYVFWGIRYDLNQKELRVQHIDMAGNFLWDSSGVLISDEFASYSAAVPCLSVSDSAKGTICYFYDSTGTKLQRIDVHGNLLWGEGVIPFSKGGWINMNAYNLKGIILAESYRTFYDYNIGDWHYNISAQRVDLDGNVLWGEQGIVITDSADSQTHLPELIIDNSGNCTILWRDSRTGVSNVYLQKVNLQGELLWENNGISVSIEISMKWNIDSGINLNKLGGVVVMWNDKRTGEKTLYGQSIDSYGDYLWFEDVLISSRFKMSDIKMISDIKGGAIACWYETPPEIGIHAQQVSRNGILGEVFTSIPNKELNKKLQLFYLSQNYPNPFNSSTKISYKIPEGGDVSLKIFNLNGQLVKTLISQKYQEGEYELIWNGMDDYHQPVASGVFFYKLETKNFNAVRKLVLIK